MAAPALRAEPVTDLRKIVLSEHNACGITHGGALRCAGSNPGTARKSLLLFTRGASTVLPEGVTDVAISSGPLEPHTCAVVKGELFCWGNNETGQLGTGKAGGKLTAPTRSSVVRGVVTSVAVTSGSTCVILSPDGALQCWGRNYNGSIGGGASRDTVLQPITVIASGVTSVAMGVQHTCAVADGGLQCWGLLLFREKTSRTELKPVSIIPPGRGVTAVAAAWHTCVVVRGSLQCWGRNLHGQVGVAEGARVAPTIPTTIVASGVTQVALTDRNTCAVVRGEAYCWGDNDASGQFCTAPSPPSPTPVKLAVPDVPPAGVDAVAVGMNKVCVLTRRPGDARNTLLQCTCRNATPDDPDDLEQAVPGADRGKWLAFGTEGIALAESRPRPVVRRIAPYGLWHGTIGAQPVVVVLSPESCGGGLYYYRKHARDIPLTEKDRARGGTWAEAEDTPAGASWIFSEAAPDSRTLTGEWVSEDGQRRVPIRLELQAPTEATEDGNGKRKYECNAHDQAYDEPRVAQAVQRRKVASRDTVFKGADRSYTYRGVSLLEGNITGFSHPEAARLPRLQQMLADWERRAAAGYYDCARAVAGTAMAPPDFGMGLVPVFWNARLLVLEESSGFFCGGAHPHRGIEAYRVWNLRDDQPVDVDSWISGSSGTQGITSRRLLKLVASRYGRRDDPSGECGGVLEGDVLYLTYPSSSGMVFYPKLSHAARACEEAITIPWAGMRPFLSPKGEKALRELVEK
jgi:hypothetical protein